MKKNNTVLMKIILSTVNFVGYVHRTWFVDVVITNSDVLSVQTIEKKSMEIEW